MNDRGQGGIRALFFLLALFLFGIIAVMLVGFPFFDSFMPVVSDSAAAQNADWMPFGAVATWMSRLRMLALGGFLIIFGMSALWVFMWYVKSQATVGR